MASPEALRVLRELQARPENKVCVDCETKSPQWATVSYGTFMCLECSGKHRGLGVHISFVRSVTMDAWNADQLRKMQAGGNSKLNDFFKQYGVDKATDIKLKYSNRVAEIYRDKIRAEVEGRPFTAPPPGSIKVDLGPAPVSAGNSRPGSAGRAAPGASNGHDDWGDWGASGGANAPRGGSYTNGGSTANGAARGGGDYTMAQLQASAADKESFFERRMMENASKPEGLAPSQGGKYVGFGSAPPPRPNRGGGGGGAAADDVGLLLSKGLQSLTVVAGSAAGTASEVLRHGTAQASALLQEKQVAETAKQLQEKGAALASAGWSGLRSLYANVASTVESAAKESGYKIDLGSRQVAQSLRQEQQVSQLAASGYGGYGSGGSGGYGGGGGYGGNNMQHSMSEGRFQQQQQHAGNSSSGFAGFGEGPANGGGGGRGAGGGGAGWDEWDNGNAGGARAPVPKPAHKSASTPAMAHKQPDDDWGTW